MAPYPELLWVFPILSLDPRTAPPGYEDGWFSFLGIHIATTIPAIPSQYRREYLDKRALYITGVPANVSPPEMSAFFGKWGEVDKCIVVVDLVSKDTFRWVVMGSTEEARRVVEGTDGMRFVEGDGVFVLRVRWANGPEKHVDLVGGGLDVDVGDVGDVSVTHRHLSPRVKREHRISTSTTDAIWDVKSDEEVLEEITDNLKAYAEERGEKFDLDYWRSTAGNGEDLEEVENDSGITTVITAPENFVTQATSWANIAGTGAPSHQVIDIAPTSRIVAGPRLKPVGRIPSISGPRGGESHVQTIRVVHLLGIPNNLNLRDISKAVREGALRAIRFGVDAETGSRWAGIVFQHASEAEAFWQVLSREKSEGRPERFKCIVEAVRGDPFQQDDILRAMGPPTFASRRLTIVKSKFFFMFGEKNLSALCEKLVGKENIELIWLYNGGNATIVFADVESAMVVKERLDDMAAGRGLASGQSVSTWEGLQTTFSKDPCVSPLELKTAMQ